MLVWFMKSNLGEVFPNFFYHFHVVLKLNQSFMLTLLLKLVNNHI